MGLHNSSYSSTKETQLFLNSSSILQECSSVNPGPYAISYNTPGNCCIKNPILKVALHFGNSVFQRTFASFLISLWLELANDRIQKVFTVVSQS